MIEVQTKYILPEPTLLPNPVSPEIILDPVIDFTAKDATYLLEACDAFREDFDEALVRYQGLDEESACNWVVRGFTIQGWLNLEQQLIALGLYTESLRTQIEFYKQQLVNQQKAIQNVDKRENP